MINGKERVTSAPAVRVATDIEIKNYERVRKEIEEEEMAERRNEGNELQVSNG